MSAPKSASASATASAQIQPAEHGETRGPCSARGGLSNSVWRPVVTKTLSVAAAMLGLAAIGTVSSLHDARGGLDASSAASNTNTAQRAALLHAAEALFVSPGDATSERLKERPAAGGEHVNAMGSAPSSASTSVSAPPSGSAPPTASASTSGVTADGKIILNTANAEELDRLPGVGKKTAERILELRARLGRFKKVQDLLRVKGIGNKSLQKLLPLIVLDPV